VFAIETAAMVTGACALAGGHHRTVSWREQYSRAGKTIITDYSDRILAAIG
jgi:hypothetical protein